jgi:ABC-type multidrug transport system fused ATPase/permease subunit
VSWLVQARLADVANTVAENTEGVRVVRAFTAEQRQLGLLDEQSRRLRWANVKNIDIRADWAPALENLPRLGTALVLSYGGWLVLHGQLTVGAIVAFSAYVLMLQVPFRMLGMLMMLSRRAAASALRIYEILDEQPEVVDRPGAIDLVECLGDVVFRRRRVRLPETAHRSSAGSISTCARATTVGARRPDGHRQVDDRAPAVPLLRRDRWADPRRQRGRPGPDPDEPPPPCRAGPRRAVPVLGVGARQHRVRKARRHLRGRRGGGQGGARPRVHPGAGGRLRHGGRRARLHAVGRPAASASPSPARCW